MEKGQDIALQRFDFRTLRRNRLGHGVDAGTHKGLELRELHQTHTFQALGEDEKALIGHLDDFVHDREAAYGIEVAGLRRIHAGFALRNHHDGLVLTQGVDELYGAFPADCQRQDGMREEHRIAHGEDRQGPIGFLLRR
ncbi:MAG TPA: hypothetical protein VJQ82_19115 [Terriglobales bacterium]|nr:hypothetical protein [Terriglobales bacterium]